MNEISDPTLLRNLDVQSLPLNFRFQGKLLVQENHAWLEVRGNVLQSLTIIDDSFVERLMDNVPCFIGGGYLYEDLVILTGTLVANDNKFSIGVVETGRLSREDEGDYEF